MRPLSRIVDKFVVLDVPNVDTDQINPARFLATQERSGFGEHLFHDWRHGPAGEPDPSFPLNAPGARGRQVLVAGHNFGCGVVPRARALGPRGVGVSRNSTSTSIADIFRNNALKIGLLPVTLPPELYAELLAHPDSRVVVDLLEQTVGLEGSRSARFRDRAVRA